MYTNENKQDFIAWATRNDFQHHYFDVHGENYFQRADGLAFSIFDNEFVMPTAGQKYKTYVMESALLRFNIPLVD